MDVSEYSGLYYLCSFPETTIIEIGKSIIFIKFIFYYLLGVALSILALLPYMIQRFNEPDDFCLSCAAIVGQVTLATCTLNSCSFCTNNRFVVFQLKIS